MLQGIPTKHVNLILWLKVNIFLLILFLGSWLVAIRKSTKSKFQHTRKNGINFSLSCNTRVKLGKMPTPLATLTHCVFIFLLPWAKQQERSCVCLSQTSSKGVTLKIKNVVSIRENASSCMSGSMLPNTDSEISLLSCHLKTRLLSPAASTICQPLRRGQLLMSALWLVLYSKGRNSKAASHYFECDINGINILTPHLPRVGNLESQVWLVIELWSDVIDR